MGALAAFSLIAGLLAARGPLCASMCTGLLGGVMPHHVAAASGACMPCGISSRIHANSVSSLWVVQLTAAFFVALACMAVWASKVESLPRRAGASLRQFFRVMALQR